MNDAEATDLALKIARGEINPSRFGDLFKEFFDRLYRFLRGRPGYPGDQDIKDACQTAFLKAFDQVKKGNFRQGNFRSWLFKIGDNALKDELYKRTPPPLANPDVVPAPSRDVETEANMSGVPWFWRQLELVQGFFHHYIPILADGGEAPNGRGRPTEGVEECKVALGKLGEGLRRVQKACHSFSHAHFQGSITPGKLLKILKKIGEFLDQILPPDLFFSRGRPSISQEELKALDSLRQAIRKILGLEEKIKSFFTQIPSYA